VAADAVHMAGPGEVVYFVAAREAAESMPNRFVPVDHAIVGIVDAVEALVGDGP
jgi:microcompartment protein CcmK/EutM